MSLPSLLAKIRLKWVVDMDKKYLKKSANPDKKDFVATQIRILELKNG